MVFTQKATLQALMYCAAVFAAKPANFKLASVQKVLEGCGLMPEFLQPPSHIAHPIGSRRLRRSCPSAYRSRSVALQRGDDVWDAAETQLLTCSSSFRSQGKSKHSGTLKQSPEERYRLEEKEIKSRETPILIIYPSQCTPFCNLWYH